MDVVITYVDGNDAVWQEQYAAATSRPVLQKRFRDWGTLKYLLRGIEKYMPFIENVFLLVSGKSQVPDWVDNSVLKVVLHSDIIPPECLPTFNSTTIEMFMHRIPGLSEEFIYFNDDMFPVNDCRAEDFFVDGCAAIKFHRLLFTGGMYRRQVRNSDYVARRALGLKPSLRYVRPQHTCSPMLKSENDACFKKVYAEIMSSITMLRSPENLNQYVFLDYMFYRGKAVSRRISNKHLSFAVHSISSICSSILEPTTSLVCINDVKLTDAKYEECRPQMLDAFRRRLPEKSRFER